ncbi:hypothetical protein [Enterococcus casseliflavus]|uniref:hypothetical protein n=1 Tax=Enterococcus casseliflavus TaxID=37734 RepID=UPI002952EA33|nr:hypothetical protein [Enterococcus casseliflavus]MDV7690037.1 hypothetical protein [Enterococcus casseliflavus]
MAFGKFNSEILNTIDGFQLEEIESGIDELESCIGKSLLGERFNEKLELLYVLKRHAEQRMITREIHELKEDILREWLLRTSLSEARVRTFNTWAKFQNQLEGAGFVCEGLKNELEQLQLMEVAK